MVKAKFYAVKSGVKTGIYRTWAECETQVKGYSGAEYKSFNSESDALHYLEGVVVEKEESTKRTIALDGFVDSKVKVYVDGSYDAKNERYSWAYVVYQFGKVIHQDFGVGTNENATKLRNVAGELSAAMRATKWAVSNNEEITIIYDYQGIESWVNRTWKTKNEFTKAYCNFMEPYFLKGVVTFKKVKGHSGVEGNEVVDGLAKQALGLK